MVILRVTSKLHRYSLILSLNFPLQFYPSSTKISDKRTASHIAAAEGNVAAVKVLADFGADLTLEDRWGNSVQGEAERSNARKLLTYLKSVSKKKSGNTTGDLSSHGKAA